MSFVNELLGPRIEEFGVDLLYSDESVLGGLDGVHPGGQVSKNQDATLKGGFKFSWDQFNDLPLDWFTVRFRPWVKINNLRFSLGIYLPSSVTRNNSGTATTWDIESVDKLSIVNSDCITSTYTAPANSPILTMVQGLITSTGEDSYLFTPSGKTTPEMMTWPAGTPKLSVINDLLQKINYETLWVDAFGRYRSDPYVDPKNSDPVHHFQEGETAIHSPNYEVTQDTLSVPNEVICMTTGSDTQLALVAVARNQKMSSPYSIPNRNGRIISMVYTGVEAADQKTLNDIAARNLLTNSTPPKYISVSHATVPLELNQVVMFSDGQDQGVKAQVNETVVTLTPGSLMTGKWLVVGN